MKLHAAVLMVHIAIYVYMTLISIMCGCVGMCVCVTHKVCPGFSADVLHISSVDREKENS